MYIFNYNSFKHFCVKLTVVNCLSYFFYLLPQVMYSVFGVLPCPLKKYWNFEAVFQRNSAGIPEVNIWNNSGILMELHWNAGGILPTILSKFTACFPELFR